MREVGISAVSCIALLALRMRVSMSAIGSVSIVLSYQLLFVIPGIEPWCANVRRQIRQRPNFLKTARGRPHLVQRVYSRTLKRCLRDCLTTRDFLAIYLPSSESVRTNGSPSAVSSA